MTKPPLASVDSHTSQKRLRGKEDNDCGREVAVVGRKGGISHLDFYFMEAKVFLYRKENLRRESIIQNITLSESIWTLLISYDCINVF